MQLALDDAVEVFVSDAVLAELRGLPAKAIAFENGITAVVVEDFIATFLRRATFLVDVPRVFDHPIDPKDSCYVNLAIAADAKLIVSRDNHLLNLTNPAKPWSRDFRERFPDVRVLRPDEYLAERQRDLE